MKRIVAVITILSALNLTACGPKDKNLSLVKKEFLSYVQNNFDDPKAVKEIVSIAAGDTVSLEKMKSLVALSDSTINATKELYRIKDSIATANLGVLASSITKQVSPYSSDAYTGRLVLVELMTLLRKTIAATETLYYQQSILNHLGDSLKYVPAVYVYEIKYRKRYPDGLKLETAYAYIDSLSGFKSICPERSDGDIMCPEYSAVFNKSKDCMVAIHELEELYRKRDENYEELEKLVLKYN